VEPLPGGTPLNRRLLWAGVLHRSEQFAAGGDTVIGVGRPSRLALLALVRARHQASFFDAMDAFPEFYRGLSRRSMARVEAEVANGVDTVWASSSALLEKFRGRGQDDKLRPVFNAFDNSRFGPPAEQRPQPPVLGYTGTISDWFDWGLVIRLARAAPQCRVRLVGPLFTAVPADLPDNVELLPACPQEQVEAYLEGFSVGLIPFRSNPLTQGVDPLKYYEYRAKGLAVITTGFGEMALRGAGDGVFRADAGSDLQALVAEALAFRPRLDELNAGRVRNDWAARFGQPGLFVPELDITGVAAQTQTG
jgi:hypothetical protein